MAHGSWLMAHGSWLTFEGVDFRRRKLEKSYDEEKWSHSFCVRGKKKEPFSHRLKINHYSYTGARLRASPSRASSGGLARRSSGPPRTASWGWTLSSPAWRGSTRVPRPTFTEPSGWSWLKCHALRFPYETFPSQSDGSVDSERKPVNRIYRTIFPHP